MNAPNLSPVKTLQVIVAALIMGVVVFGGIVVSIMDWKVASASLTPLAIAAWAILVASAGMVAVVPRLVFKKIAAASGRSNVESTERNNSHKAVQAKTIVRYAMLEMAPREIMSNVLKALDTLADSVGNRDSKFCGNGSPSHQFGRLVEADNLLTPAIGTT